MAPLPVLEKASTDAIMVAANREYSIVVWMASVERGGE